MDFERWNEKFAGFSVFINSLQEQLKPYAEEWKAVEQNAKSLLIDFTEKTKPLRAFNILADHQFTYWNPLQSDDVEKILNSYDVDQYLLERMEDKGFIDYDTLCKEMESSELLSATNKSILQQTVKAIEAELYDLALAGAVIVFDGVLTEATSNASTNISRRIEDIRNKMEKLSDEEWECLGEKEITVFGMYITWTKTMEGFQRYSEFDKPETEPKSLNRHWIAHGRKTTIATKLDCCKMINALYGLLCIGNPALLSS